MWASQGNRTEPTSDKQLDVGSQENWQATLTENGISLAQEEAI